ncbi:phage tail protein [Limosilactobacillus antri]|uniref:phage tail protein n=1 Tax=Limosilactobacillus antri TaxID=227943 RepID=UPI001F5A3474|nr:phage tail protein [Limosilactobacillus antri]
MLEGVSDAILMSYKSGKVYRFGDKSLGTNKIELKGLRANPTAINGSNKIQAHYENTLKPTGTIILNAVPFEVLADLTSWDADGSDGFYKPSKTYNKVGLVAVFPKWGVAKERVYAFKRGVLTLQNVSGTTDSDSKKSMATVSLSFAAEYDENGDIEWAGDFDTDAGADAAIKMFNWSQPVDPGEYDDDTKTPAVKTATPSNPTTH